MAQVVESKGKTIEEALDNALKELGCKAGDVDYEVLAEPSKGIFGIFGVKPAHLRVTKKAPAVVKEKTEVTPVEPVMAEKAAEPAEAVSETCAVPAEEQLQRAEQFFQDVFAAMHIEVQWQRRDTSEGVVYDLIGDNLGILIGKHGQTLDSLQYLVNLTANRGNAENRVHIILDIEGYRARREETLMRLAGHLAEKACRIGDEVHLEPMNRHERKIIHMALQDNRRVSTYSAGDEPRRYVVIAPRRRRRRRDYDRENYGEE